MDYQDLLEQSYTKLTTKEHRKDFAQFFTPSAIATLMASYILDNPECKDVLDPAAGLSVFARALDENLKLINEPYAFTNIHHPAVYDCHNSSLTYAQHTIRPLTLVPNDRHNLISFLSLLALNSEEAKQLFARARDNNNLEYQFALSPRMQQPALNGNSQLRPAPAKTAATDSASSSTISGSSGHGANGRTGALRCDLSMELRHLYDWPETNSGTNTPVSSLMSSSSGGGSCNKCCNDSTTGTATGSTAAGNNGSVVPELPPLTASHTLPTTEQRNRIRTIELTAYELDPIIYEFNNFFMAQHPFCYVNYHFRQKDYLKANYRERYDGIICNPPYLTFKEYAHKSRTITTLEKHLGLTLPGRINLYALFLLKSLSQLRPGGRCAYLIPYEFLNSSFGVRVKEQFLKQRSLAHVITFNIKGQIFDNATTTCGLFLFDNSRVQEHVEFITVHSMSELARLTVRLCPNLFPDPAVPPQPTLAPPLSAILPEIHLSHSTTSQETSDPTNAALSGSTAVTGSAALPGAADADSADAPYDRHLPTGAFQQDDPYQLPIPDNSEQQRLMNILEAAPALFSTLGKLHIPVIDGADGSISSRAGVTALNLNFSTSSTRLTLTGDWRKFFESLHHSGNHHLAQSELQGRRILYHQLNAKQKWHIYYQERSLMGQWQDHQMLSMDQLSTFDRFIKVKRGLATGANKFFLFNNSRIAEFKLDRKFFVPVIPRANLVKNPIFTSSDFNRLSQANALVYLLNAPDQSDDPALSAYLKYGESIAINQRYLTRHRCPWYALERREVAPILMSVFNRGSINVVRNEAGIFNLTTFHSIFVLEPEQTDLIFAYLMTPLAKDIILQNRREYGGGLEKLEPLDINHAACVNFNALSGSDVTSILELYQEYRRLVLEASDQNRIINGETALVLQQIAAIFGRLLS